MCAARIRPATEEDNAAAYNAAVLSFLARQSTGTDDRRQPSVARSLPPAIAQDPVCADRAGVFPALQRV